LLAQEEKIVTQDDIIYYGSMAAVHKMKGGLTNTSLTLQGCHGFHGCNLSLAEKRRGRHLAILDLGKGEEDRMERREGAASEARLQSACWLAANGFVDGANGIEESKVRAACRYGV
jgi:hypothetical protein